jgi:hypothetical protein
VCLSGLLSPKKNSRSLHSYHKDKAAIRLQDTSREIISFHSVSTLPITKAVTSLHLPAQPWIVIIVIAIRILLKERLI